MKNLPGLLFKFLIVFCFFAGFSALAAFCYETVILHYPDRNWTMISYERKEEDGEVIAKFIPKFDYENNWREMLIIHSYKEAKKAGETADGFIETVIGTASAGLIDITTDTIKVSPTDAIMSWCGKKKPGSNERSQCALVKVAVGMESVISIEFITREYDRFPERKKIWLPILENSIVYYSYYRWDRMLNKALCIEM